MPRSSACVLSSHQHDDHAGGDLTMLPIAEVVAQRNARANLVAKRQPYYEETLGTPTIAFWFQITPKALSA